MIMQLILALSYEMTVIRQAQSHEKNTNVEVKIPQYNLLFVFLLNVLYVFVCVCFLNLYCAFIMLHAS